LRLFVEILQEGFLQSGHGTAEKSSGLNGRFLEIENELRGPQWQIGAGESHGW